MSNQYSEQWLEDAKLSFEEAVVTENWALARSVIEDLQENGFGSQAITLEVALQEKQNNHE